MKKIVLFTIALLLTLAQGAWATAYDYYIAEKNGQTLTFKGTNTEPNGTNQWLISSRPLRTWNDDDINNYTKVVFDSSFDEARPTSIAGWFETMLELKFNNEEVTGEFVISDDVATGIDNAALVNNNQDGWYTLDGRKLGNMPAQKGLYIVNGKKTVVK